MRTSLTNIGNSKGIIIPAKLLKLCGFEKDVDVQIKDHSLVISRVHSLRQGWKEAFAKEPLEERLLLDDIQNTFDESEWTW